MNRREFIALVGGAAAWPVAARGQQPTSPVVQPRAPVPHVGILNYAADDDIRMRQFRAAIAGLGYIEGRNITLTLRSADRPACYDGYQLDEFAAASEVDLP
jgi:putative ABC transport system substrate-binding protein